MARARSPAETRRARVECMIPAVRQEESLQAGGRRATKVQTGGATLYTSSVQCLVLLFMHGQLWVG